jgi:hypothetical protein
LVGGDLTILKNTVLYSQLGRIIPYIMEHKKMFETTNQNNTSNGMPDEVRSNVACGIPKGSSMFSW